MACHAAAACRSWMQGLRTGWQAALLQQRSSQLAAECQPQQSSGTQGQSSSTSTSSRKGRRIVMTATFLWRRALRLWEPAGCPR